MSTTMSAATTRSTAPKTTTREALEREHVAQAPPGVSPVSR